MGTEQPPSAGYVLEYDAEYRWLVMSDPEGASQIVAREVTPDDAAYLIAGYGTLDAARERPSALDVDDDEVLPPEVEHFFRGREAAITAILAYGAEPPEYPGLVLVPKADIDNLRQYAPLRARLTEPDAGEGTELPLTAALDLVGDLERMQSLTPTARAHIMALRAVLEGTHPDAPDTTEATLRAAVEKYVAWQYRMPNARRFTLTDLRAALQQSAVQPEGGRE